ncbi:MAG: hypothetical protein SF029_06755 [bacterium]|nr:hypothetical protein [bacterium]
MLLLVLVGCDGSGAAPAVPTRVSVETVGTAEATPDATSTAIVRGIITLPPSWTPVPTSTIGPTATPAPLPTATAVPSLGTIYYIYAGDSIAAVDVATRDSRLIVTFGVGQPITDLSLSPDGLLLAYVAPGNGSAREVYVSSLDGTYRQQVSCLGFAEVRGAAWSADSQRLAWFAGQSPDSPVDLFTAVIAGSNTCPTGNNQREVLSLDSTLAREVVWSPDGTRLFFSDGVVYSVDVATGQRSPALTEVSGLGSDFNLRFRPGQPTMLTILRADLDFETGASGGRVVELDVSNPSELLAERSLPGALIHRVEWSGDGRYLLISEDAVVNFYDSEQQRILTLVTGQQTFARAIFSPDAQQMAYIGLDPANPAQEQIFVVDLSSGESRQITALSEGSIGSVVWAEG